MEELPAEEPEDLLQELEGESQEDEALPPEVEELLRDLQSGGAYLERYRAAHGLGNVEESSPRILRALTVAQKSDPHPDVRRAATGSLRAPVHKEYLQQHPHVVASMEQALDQATRRGAIGGGAAEQRINLIRCLGAGSVAGLVVGLVIGYWWAGVSLSSEEGSGCGIPFLISFTIGAAIGAPVGAVAGAEERGRKDRGASIVAGLISAAVIASLSWVPVLVFRVVLLGGP